MPIYVYRCTSCENRYEMREGFDAPSTQSCPSCGSTARRVFVPPPIVFKGSGFYVTDSRSKNGAASYSPSDGNGSSESSSSSSSETTAASASSDSD